MVINLHKPYMRRLPLLSDECLMPGFAHRPPQPIFSHRPVYTYVKISGRAHWLRENDVTLPARPMAAPRFAHGPKAFSVHCRDPAVRAKCSQVCKYPPTQKKVNIILFYLKRHIVSYLIVIIITYLICDF